MGIFSKLKNAISGGGATVTVEIGNAAVGTEFPVTVRAQVGGSDIQISRVYVQLVGHEEVRLRGVKRTERRGAELVDVDSDLERAETTFEANVTLSGAQTLAANSSHEWTGKLAIPAGLPPTFQGRNARHAWKVLAGLDCWGNDPDSGWQIIAVRA